MLHRHVGGLLLHGVGVCDIPLFGKASSNSHTVPKLFYTHPTERSKTLFTLYIYNALAVPYDR